MPSLYFSAAHKSSGKTTISIGVTAEMRRRGLAVAPFKKGPDYIDPMWLGLAAGRSCFNLDFHTQAPDEIRASFQRDGQGADLRLIEGNVGLYDSVHLHGEGSNAELVKLLSVPLVLVIDCKGLGRGIAPLLLGFQAFDPDLPIAGVILNRIGGGRHGDNLLRVVEHYTDLPVLGMLPRLAELDIDERHLGLVPSNEARAAEDKIERIRTRVAEHVDLDALLEVASRQPEGPAGEGVFEAADTVAAAKTRANPTVGSSQPRLTIGIARDAAFGFYYPDDLAALERAGADLISFSPLDSPELPEVDALLLGGGFPEFHMEALEANRGMRAAVADFVASGKPVYAECGGLMYLCERLHWQERSARMCGVLQADVAMHAKPQGRGYVRLRETGTSPWSGVAGDGDIQAHEFHHSAVVNADPDWTFAYQVLRGTGVDGRHDGIVHKRLLASYSHLRGVGGNRWPERFVAAIRASLGD
ncbi:MULTISPECIES: cobyrinate a,c-diamide synthase [Thiorhodovibrio]|uniref:cobyrinate a,c-diamide synthase n=1 Tax=Thiorhodovibrio TaxID=61593 RepID=UPI001911A7BD|nr:MULTISPECIES: cobyrinate a,c-diamide synthase [Thiorhodovibrio]MBK5970668.1 cobyrinic acid a,c-diamide synthase [Thiorhodovibrio winogradskyi]WPL14211.1 Intracellular sulfur oxidation protein DsrP [Thiorhodovibrio litoralis]